MRPPSDSPFPNGGPPTTTVRERIRAPELFADAQAREVARLVGEQAHVAPGRAAGLINAVEAYDLASARLQWVQACRCQPGSGQRAAIKWHAAQLHDAHVAMLTSLRDATAVEPKQAS